MTKQQAIALRYPCLLAEETMHQRFFTMGPLGTVIVSVNTGYE